MLRGVDLDVAPGSIFALLGSNGAGKTTAVKILSTLLRTDAGAARVNGFDVATQAAHVRESISLTGHSRRSTTSCRAVGANLVLVARQRHLDDPGTVADDLSPMPARGRCRRTRSAVRWARSIVYRR